MEVSKDHYGVRYCGFGRHLHPCDSVKNACLSFWNVAVVNAGSGFMLCYPVYIEPGVCPYGNVQRLKELSP